MTEEKKSTQYNSLVAMRKLQSTSGRATIIASFRSLYINDVKEVENNGLHYFNMLVGLRGDATIRTLASILNADLTPDPKYHSCSIKLTAVARTERQYSFYKKSMVKGTMISHPLVTLTTNDYGVIGYLEGQEFLRTKEQAEKIAAKQRQVVQTVQAAAKQTESDLDKRKSDIMKKPEPEVHMTDDAFIAQQEQEGNGGFNDEFGGIDPATFGDIGGVD